jgi:hypothetical protein
LRRSVTSRVFNLSGSWPRHFGSPSVETLKRRAIEPLSVEDRSALALRKLFGWGQSFSLPLQQEKASIDPTSEKRCNYQIIISHIHAVRADSLRRHDSAEACNAAGRSGDTWFWASALLVPIASSGTRAANKHEDRYMNLFFQRRVIQKERAAKQHSYFFCHLSDLARKGLRFEAH